MDLSTFTIGCDPEIFLTNKRGKLVSAHETGIKGTKQAPFKMKSGGAVQIDGTALEFNTAPVSLTDFDRFESQVMRALRDMRELTPGFSFRVKPTAVFDEKYWETIPDENKELGCNPDWNAYTMEPNPAPDGDRGTMRTGAGHIHLGWDDTCSIPVDHPEHLEVCAGITKMLDLYVGVGTLLFDDDKDRRSLYGRAGAFRPKPYGVEYRVPSNAWLTNSSRRRFIHSCVQMAVRQASRGTTITQYRYKKGYDRPNITEEVLQEVINTSDVEFAKLNHTYLTGVSSSVY